MDSSFSILVTNLNAANLLMSVYCGIIAGADEVLRGSFVHNERAWTGSVICQVAGALYLLSAEVSVLTITLITCDRVLCSLRGTGFHLQLGRRSSLSACVLVWIVGATISAVFVFPSVSQMAMPRRSSICVPLPVGGDRRQASYPVVIDAGLRPLLLLLVSGGQAWLYRWVHNHKTPSDPESLRPARQFLQVAVTNIVCWAVVSCVTLWSLVSRKVVNEEVTAALAILVHPVCAALNPGLYLVSRGLEDRRVRQEARLMQLLKSRLCRK
jgi:hypothetical protein